MQDDPDRKEQYERNQRDLKTAYQHVPVPDVLAVLGILAARDGEDAAPLPSATEAEQIRSEKGLHALVGVELLSLLWLPCLKRIPQGTEIIKELLRYLVECESFEVLRDEVYQAFGEGRRRGNVPADVQRMFRKLRNALELRDLKESRTPTYSCPWCGGGLRRADPPAVGQWMHTCHDDAGAGGKAAA